MLSIGVVLVFPAMSGCGPSALPRHGEHIRHCESPRPPTPVHGLRKQRRPDRGMLPGSAGIHDRQSVVSGKSVSVRVDPGGRRLITKQNSTTISKVTTNHDTLTEPKEHTCEN